MLQRLHSDGLGKLILRLAVGVTILLHGIHKVLNPGSFDWLGSLLANVGLPTFLAYGVLLGEIVGPLMVILGSRARIGGLLIAGNMVVAVLLAHLGEFWTLNGQGGWTLELQAMFFAAAVAVMLLGSGRFAINPD
ncbi:DoxX family protein [Salinicola aestuarinus]|uniref:DoxX family protein n=1 Tax=Salinicola aestuarinus TaxID=1949082 RepID=UPI000DA13B26|nr:DoxX family protein [Salinicola aestuarinus]